MKERQTVNRGRRRFLIQSATAASLAATLAPTASGAAGKQSWAQEADIIIVGSGAAALSSAIAAMKAGQNVLLLESGVSAGGTTIKSDGGYWIPNNRLMREAGRTDARDDAIAFMLQHAYPASFNQRLPQFGLSALQYDLIATFFDNAAPIVDELETDGVLRYTGFPLIDYYDSPDNKAPYGRTLLPSKPDGTLGGGRELVHQLRQPLTAKNVPILLRHRVTGVARNADGEVIGVTAEGPTGPLLFRARKAVIFGAGGYSQNPDLVTRFQPGPIYGGCAVPTNQGDFVSIGLQTGAMLGNMTNAWRAQVVLEQVLETRSVARDIFHIPGDSMLVVNRFGWRVHNEKRDYNDRTRVHYDWNVTAAEQSNRLLFMIYDQRTKDVFAGNAPIPDKATAAPYEIRADSLPALRVAIQQRLDSLADKIGAYPLGADFDRGLMDQVALFNKEAATGVDTQFDRGGSRYDKEWHTGYAETKPDLGGWPENKGPNPTLYPLASAGPYFAVILAPGALDTNGGPQTDAHGRVLDTSGKPIPGLYGAGNCIASPAGAAYWGAGSTLGLAITFGTLAGRAAAAEPIKRVA
jgi:succinate dehydrogenase/fumarate reductase flavoprotein subunit